MKKLNEIENLTQSLQTFDEVTELDIQVEWIVDKAIPKKCVIMFVGRRGIGKTWFMIRMIECILQGKDFLGMPTVQIPTFYVDFENPLPVIHDRLKTLKEGWKMKGYPAFYWHRYHDPAPPRIDSVGWVHYQRFLKENGECLIVFDTLRSAQMQNLNDDQDSAKLMERLKHLSDIGATVVLLHHTPKYDTTTFKASGTLADLADHMLILKDAKERGVYCYSTLEKTRYDEFEVYLTRNGNHDFAGRDDPFLAELAPIIQLIKEHPGCNQKFIKESFPQNIYPHFSSDSTWKRKLDRAEELKLFTSKKTKKERNYWVT
jgi:hypothetical protein